MANEIAADSQIHPVPSETPSPANDTPEGTVAPRIVRFADRETVLRAGKEIFRRHARLFQELAK